MGRQDFIIAISVQRPLRGIIHDHHRYYLFICSSSSNRNIHPRLSKSSSAIINRVELEVEKSQFQCVYHHHPPPPSQWNFSKHTEIVLAKPVHSATSIPKSHTATQHQPSPLQQPICDWLAAWCLPLCTKTTQSLVKSFSSFCRSRTAPYYAPSFSVPGILWCLPACNLLHFAWGDQKFNSDYYLAHLKYRTIIIIINDF